MTPHIKRSEYHTDFLPYWGLPLLIIHFIFIGFYFAAAYWLFPGMTSLGIKYAISGLLNPSILVLSFYLSSLVYLFTHEDDKIRFKLFTLIIIGLAVLGALFHIYLPEMSFPQDFIPRLLVILLGSGLGAVTCIFYRHIFCGKIEPLI